MKDVNNNLQKNKDWELGVAASESLIARTNLMLEIQRYIEAQGWSLEEAAIALTETKPRLQNLLNGESAQFTVEQLISMLAKAGLQVRIEVLPKNSPLP
jgi:predicted XRE-type DNA-binding protein